MPDVGGVSNRGPVPVPNEKQALEKTVGQPGQTTVWPNLEEAPAVRPPSVPDGPDAPIGPPGLLGQPTGQPVPAGPGQTQLMPDAIAGRDPSQLIAAEQMRAAGGAAATDELLGLNHQPTIIGAFFAPPGNSEALRHMTPSMKRATVRALLMKQRAQMRRLLALLERDSDSESSEQGDDDQYYDQEVFGEEIPNERERRQLASTVQMLYLLEELLAMQDYTLSRMGTFSKG